MNDEGQSFQFNFPNDTVGFDAEAFDHFIRSQGVQFVHWRAMRCPIGLTDPDDVRIAHEHHENCSNGFLYTLSGTVTCLFLGNSSSFKFTDPGRQDGSTVSVTIPRFYDDGEHLPVSFAPFDRLYLKELTVPVDTWHTFSAHASGTDRLMFPALKVYDLVDARGNYYKQGVDFDIVKGQLVWRTGKSPGIDPKTRKGVVCSVRFSYQSFWYVKSLSHEVRIAQTEDEYGNRSVQRMPQAAVLQREMHFQKEYADSQAQNPDNRQHPGPPVSSFGPR